MEEKSIVKELKNTQCRFVIELGPDLHREIKTRAAQRNMTIRMYVLRAVLKQMHQEDKRK